MKKTILIFSVAVVIFAISSLRSSDKETMPQEQAPELLSGSYLGQTPPLSTPVKFAPGIISTTTGNEWGIAFSSDGKECYFSRRVSNTVIMTLKEENEKWESPVVATYFGQYYNMEPYLSSDGNELFFASNRPMPSTSTVGYFHTWYLERNDQEWSEPILFELPSQVEFILYPSFTNEETIYFSSQEGSSSYIFISKKINGVYQEPEKLGGSINSYPNPGHPFIAPDETYLIFSSIAGENYSRDIFISFRNQDGSWKDAINMSDDISTDESEITPFVTYDGKYLFFSRNNDIYWVDAKIIDNYR